VPKRLKGYHVSSLWQEHARHNNPIPRIQQNLIPHFIQYQRAIMHVLYLYQHFSTPKGKTGTRSYEMAKRLVSCGHKVTMVCGSSVVSETGLSCKPSNSIRKGTVDGIEVVELHLPYSNYDNFLQRSLTFLKFALHSTKIAIETDYDILFATSTPLTVGIPGIVMKFFKPRKPFVFEVRDLWPELPRAMGVITNPLALTALSFLEWMSYACADACIGLSPGIVEGIRRRCNPRKSVEMIPNASDLELFRPAYFSVQSSSRGQPPNQEPKQEQLAGANPTDYADQPMSSIPMSGLRAVFTGAHGVANGLEAVLDVARLLKERGRQDIHVIFIGDGKLKPDLVERARRDDLKNCIFLNPVSKLQLVSILQEVDVGLMILANVPAFYYGTSPNKFFDYISSGLPVLNNYPGWLADLITKHKCGIAVPPDDPDKFANSLMLLAEDPSRRREMAVNARRLAEQEFDRKKWADRFVKYLETVADRRS